MIPQAVTSWLADQGYGDTKSNRPVGGGCINNGARIESSAGQTFFLKTNSHAPPDMFAREAEGLAALKRMNGPRIPEVFLIGEGFLLLEDLKPGSPNQSFWQDFGRQLARLHHNENPQFGFERNNYIGSTSQINTWTDDGCDFFGRHRLMYQAKLAKGKGYFKDVEFKQIEVLIQRLPELLPEQAASLIHGDLWKGNAIADERGAPVLIDPATHFGWAEAELAMTALFGGFPTEFYDAYQEEKSLEPGWRERFPIYNLYHLINHLNLFGMGYHSQVISILMRYT